MQDKSTYRDGQTEHLFAEDAEKAILTIVLSAPTSVGKVIADLEAKHFWREKHRYIWRAVERCVEDGMTPDYIGVVSKLDAEDVGHKVPGGYLDELQVEVPRTDQLEPNAETVIEMFERRRLRAQFRELEQKIASREIDSDGAKSYLQRKWIEDDDNRGARRLADVVDEVIDDAETADEGAEDPFWSTGIDVVDEVLGGGLYTSRFTLIGGRPGHGKTSLTVAMISGLAERHGFTGDVWYSDGNEKDIGVAVVAHLSEIDTEAIRKGDLDAHEWRRVYEARATIDEWDVEIRRASRPIPSEVLMTARSRAASTDRYFCVVDYLQNCDAGYTGDQSDRKNAAEAAQTMDRIGTELDAIAIGLSQFNRGVREGEIPKMRHLKHTGKLEEAVNDFLVWHRPDWQKDDATEHDERRAVLKLAKSKHQASGGRRAVMVDAQLGINQFSHYDGQKIASETNHE